MSPKGSARKYEIYKTKPSNAIAADYGLVDKGLQQSAVGGSTGMDAAADVRIWSGIRRRCRPGTTNLEAG